MKKEESSYLQGISDTEQAEDGLYSDLKRGLIDEVMYTRQVQRVRTERKKLTHLLFELQHSMTDSVFKACDTVLELATAAES
jgi:hypothetical protein